MAAPTQEQLEARLEALKAARDTGALTVSHDGVSTTYRSLSEIERIIASLQARIDGLSSPSRVRAFRVFTRDGW